MSDVANPIWSTIRALKYRRICIIDTDEFATWHLHELSVEATKAIDYALNALTVNAMFIDTLLAAMPEELQKRVHDILKHTRSF